MKFQILKDHTLESCQEFLKKNAGLYDKQDRDALLKHLEKDDFLDNPLELPMITELPKFDLGGDASDWHDVENVIAMYDALGELPITQASDPCFWGAFAHTYGLEYVLARCPHDTTHLFCKGKAGFTRMLFVNQLSKLWWVGHMLYDKNNSADHWQLLRVIPDVKTSFSSNVMLLSSSNILHCQSTLFGMLKALKERQDAGEQHKRRHMVLATTCLRRMSSTYLLDSLSEDEIKAFVSNELTEKLGKV